MTLAPSSKFTSSEPENNDFEEEKRVNKHEAKKNIDCEKMARSWNFSWPNLWLSSAGSKETLIAIRFITEEDISSNESISDAKIDCDSVASHA